MNAKYFKWVITDYVLNLEKFTTLTTKIGDIPNSQSLTILPTDPSEL